MIRRIFGVSLLCSLLFAAQAFGQATTGNITGIVTDSTGAVVPNATITVSNALTGVSITTTTGDDGVYNVTLLKPGTYKVAATAEGFAETAADVEVQVARSTSANLTLGVGDVSATVTISAEGVQTTESRSDAVLSETAISNLPINGRRFQDYVTLTPTAQVDPQRGQISLAGQRGINTNINVDGVDYNQPFFGGIRGGERSNLAFTIPQESIREFNVVTAGYSPEFGRSTGGIVNAVTKSGTNEVRGSAFYLWRPEQLSRQNEFVDEIERTRNVDATAAPTQNQFGGSIGGPFIKDKLFYFGSAEFQRFSADRQVLYANLANVTRNAASEEAYAIYTGNETSFVQTNDAWAALGKIDWQANSQNLLSVRFNYSKNNAENANATGETTLDPTTNRALSTNGTEKNRNRIVVAQLISNFSANLFNDFRFQLAREDRPRFANELAPNVSLGGVGEFGTRTFLPTTQYDERLQFADSLTAIVGDHTVKFGGEFSDIYVNQLFGFNQQGAYTMGGVAQAAFEAASLTAGSMTDRRFDVTSATYRQQIGNLLADYTVRELAFFAQDNWRIHPRFQIDFGVRAEQQYNPDPQLGNDSLISLLQNASFPVRGGAGLDPTSIPDSGWQWGPRLGFAWDVEGNGKSVLRGFGGVFYARTPLLLLAAPVNNFRTPAGDLSVQIPFSSSALSAGTASGVAAYNSFITANPGYVSILAGTGLACPLVVNPTDTRACIPNTIFRQFAIAGVNLNSSSLSSMPQLGNSEINAIASALGQSLPGLAPIGMDEDFKNPMSVQLGAAYEREVADGFVVGIDFLNVNTSRLQRNRELNLPAPVNLTQYAQSVPGLTQAQRDQLVALDTGRPIIGVTRPTNFPSFFPTRARPVPALGSVQIREASARSLYTAVTLRTRLSRSWGNLNAYYTISRSLSDDDNERSSGGQDAVDTFNLAPEYGPSRLDRKYQFVANPVFFLPYGFEVSGALRIRSGAPVDAIANADLNGDGLFNDRPLFPNGEVSGRNLFRNRWVTDVDGRVQKGFGFGDNRRIVLSAEFFNIFNLMNLQYSGSTVTAYCNPVAINCTYGNATNPNFLQLRNANGDLLLNNTPGSQVFQMQLGARFQF
ncbi:MAG: hypothetical protein DWQ47_13340 [Acidobacteria bacterium]|nr:MAG: hypothetical protein DWQ32_00740 [Acidobacteriota bacterium]REK02938.1 MAG: hypothetical protein DWQ38_11395 [Acidobacteriota bacterium]REK13258.1 MAG: hypothetical protein DWQ43_06430 [Acidobacteriota bacterium]REK41252.1 MAG: hypothetical protein DWQ47_13340 [Acidobacteriota bacterium]